VVGSGSSEGLVEQLLARVRELESVVVDQQQVIDRQADRIAELQRRLGQSSSTSSRPPSSDAPWDKKPAKKRSSRSRSGRKPGKSTRLGEALTALAAAAVTVRARLVPHVPPWTLIGQFTHGRLVTPASILSGGQHVAPPARTGRWWETG
jgi:uncharacterized coiled-coil protein SlyX